MRDSCFDLFIAEFGEATISRYVFPEDILKWKYILPEKLIDYWVDEGWSSYCNGLFSFVNPSDYHDVVLEWLDDSSLITIDNFHVIAVTGLGDFYLFGEKFGCVCKILSRYGVIEILSKPKKLTPKLLNANIESIVQLIKISDLDKDNVFEKLVMKFGSLNDNEVFCFEPMIQKLHTSDFISAKKINAINYLAELRHVVKPLIMYV